MKKIRKPAKPISAEAIARLADQGKNISRFFKGQGRMVQPIQRVNVDVTSSMLVDGRTISVPLAWSWRFSEATPEQRARFEIIGSGSGIHWPEIDEDISVEGMLHGAPARRPASRHPSRS